MTTIIAQEETPPSTATDLSVAAVGETAVAANEAERAAEEAARSAREAEEAARNASETAQIAVAETHIDVTLALETLRADIAADIAELHERIDAIETKPRREREGEGEGPEPVPEPAHGIEQEAEIVAPVRDRKYRRL